MLSEKLVDEIVDFILVRHSEGSIDWDDALYAVEKEFDIDLGNDMNGSEVKQIQKAVRKARNA